MGREVAMNIQIIDNCKPYPSPPLTFSIKLEPSDNIGTLREEVARKLDYKPESFNFHLSPKDEPTHLELFSKMTDVMQFFFFFFFFLLFFLKNCQSFPRWKSSKSRRCKAVSSSRQHRTW
jgi:hypothetical protein